MWIMGPQGEVDKLYSCSSLVPALTKLAYSVTWESDHWVILVPSTAGLFRRAPPLYFTSPVSCHKTGKPSLGLPPHVNHRLRLDTSPFPHRFGGASGFLHTTQRSSPLFLWGYMLFRHLIIKTTVLNKSIMLSWKSVILLQVHFHPLSSWRSHLA